MKKNMRLPQAELVSIIEDIKEQNEKFQNI